MPNAGDRRAEKQVALEHAVAGLAGDERTLFLLHSVEGVTLNELAKERNVTASAMKSRVHRIREKVRRSAFAYLDDPERPSESRGPVNREAQ